MLKFQHTRSQCFCCVAWQHPQHGLVHNRTVVKLRGDQMNSHAMHPNPRLQSLLVGSQTWKRWQQRGMNIHQSTKVPVYKPFGQYPHEAGQHQPIRLVSINQVGQGCIKGFPAFIFSVVQNSSVQPGGLSQSKPSRCWAVGNDCANLVSPGLFGVIDQGIQV